MSTIYLAHSPAFAYDLLAIAAIKARHNPDDTTAKENLLLLDEAIQQQVGVMLHEQVCASPEYQRLYQVNDEMYIAIDALNANGESHGIATYINDRVYQRFLAKQALQAKWFSGTTLTETKHGYQV